jgi:hypothetical protein
MNPFNRSKGSKAKWGVGYREARVHAQLAAVILWTGAAISILASPGDRDLVNQLKGADFVQIYTLAHVAFEGPYPTLSTRESFNRRQVELVPASSGDEFLPVYPPTAALIFRPAAAFSYRTATLFWAIITILGYAVVVWAAWRPFRHVLPDRRFLLAAAIAFPPFLSLVLHGQTTLFPLLAFFLAWLALASGRPFAAGLALGLLSIKPQFALVMLPALLAGGEGRVLLGLLVSSAMQAAAVVATMGTQAFYAYFRTMRGLPAVEHLLEPDSWRMHSLRTLTRLVPDPAGDLVWIAASIMVIAATVRVWRSAAPLEARLGLVVIATVLVSPHLFGYDAVVLALPFIWLGGWVESNNAFFRERYWQAVYACSAFLLLPTARFLYVQASVVVLLWIFWKLSAHATATGCESISDAAV